MKLKSFILVAIVGVIGLAGCKPKETTIPGQVFIATQGRENIRLGAVEVLLIERQQVTNYLQKRQAVISDKIKLATRAGLEARQRDMANAESQVQTRQINVTNAVQNVEAAYKQVDQAKATYDQFIAAQPLLTNAVYVKLRKDLAFRTGLIPTKRNTISFGEAEVNKPYSPQTWVLDYNGIHGTSGHWVGATPAQYAEQKQIDRQHVADASKDLASTYAEINADKQALGKIQQDVDEFQVNKLHDAESLLNTAKSHLTEAQSSLAAANSHLETIKNKPPFVPPQ